MKTKITQELLREVISRFPLEGAEKSCEVYGNGHINDTYRLICDKKYVLQRINTEVFKDPAALMRNIEGVTTFLREKIIRTGGDPARETLHLVRAEDGRTYTIDSEGGYWRIYDFIDGATCYEQVKKPEDFYQSGKAFGHFQRMLTDYPAAELTETIPHFHDTPKRFRDFTAAVEADAYGRAKTAQPEIDFVMARKADMGIAADMLKNGELPLHVTHNDTKLNNIMIDDRTGQAICIIDLDTIMPGLSIFDFGDSIRFGANTAAEDEQDLSRVSLSLPLFETYARGFLTGCDGSLKEQEIRMLPQGARLMTLECGMRFLTDYLSGDSYFHISREGHNLDRCRTQFGLVADMEKKWAQMEQIIREI